MTTAARRDWEETNLYTEILPASAINDVLDTLRHDPASAASILESALTAAWWREWLDTQQEAA